MKKIAAFLAALAMTTTLAFGVITPDADAGSVLCWDTPTGTQCSGMSGTCESNGLEEGTHHDSGGTYTCTNQAADKPPIVWPIGFE